MYIPIDVVTSVMWQALLCCPMTMFTATDSFLCTRIRYDNVCLASQCCFRYLLHVYLMWNSGIALKLADFVQYNCYCCVKCIWNYGFLSYEGISGSKWPPVRKTFWSSSVITIAKGDETLVGKKPWLLHCKNAPRVLLSHTKAEKNKHEFLMLFFLVSFSSCITQEL